MEKIEILTTVPFADESVKEIQLLSERINLTISPARQPEDIPLEIWAKTEILFTWGAIPDPETVPQLRWVQSYLAGADRLLSHPLAEKEDLLITTNSGANATQVAEHTIMMMLSLGRNLPDAFARQNQSEWLSNQEERQRMKELRGSVVGIIGYGAIGGHLARLLQPFGVEILATKANAKNPHYEGYLPEGQGDPEGDYFTRLYPPEAIKSVLQESDFVIVTVPLTKKTKDMIGEKEFNSFKAGSFLVDVSRGGVVNHDALIGALVQNKLAGAALDVFPEEPLPADNPMWQMPNVIISPHMAGVSPNYIRRAVQLFKENILRYMNAEQLLNQVNKKAEKS